jgi:deazaflavin-dependent oxidoreductase (nitroreductase family)
VDIADVNRRVIEQFRAGGEVEGMHREVLVLLTTTGAKTGHRRTTPMMHHRDGDRILVIAANAGAPKDPDWYRNLVHDPHVIVEVGDETYPALAVVLTGAERDHQWTALKQAYPFFAEFEQKAGRTIPVVALTRE